MNHSLLLNWYGMCFAKMPFLIKQFSSINTQRVWLFPKTKKKACQVVQFYQVNDILKSLCKRVIDMTSVG